MPLPSSPAPAPQPTAGPCRRKISTPSLTFAPDPDPLATSGVARIDDDPSVRTAFARQVPNPRRIAMWSGAVLVLLALLLIGTHEFRQERQAGRVLDVLGISRGTGAGDSAAVSASAVGPAAPVTPPIAADAGAVKPMPTEPAAADSPAAATAPASPASAPAATRPAAATPDTPAAVAQPAAPTSPPTRVAQQHASRAPASPREACGARTQFSLYRCMQMQCSQRRWAVACPM